MDRGVGTQIVWLKSNGTKTHAKSLLRGAGGYAPTCVEFPKREDVELYLA